MDNEETKVPGLMTDAETIKSLELSLKNARYEIEVLIKANNKRADNLDSLEAFDKVIEESINRIGLAEIEDEVTDRVYDSLAKEFVKNDDFDMLVDDLIESNATRGMIVDLIKEHPVSKDAVRETVIDLVNDGLLTINADG
tara:strand:- start:57 stop:479 length:423 start_codon:yes stop_codon:yes gene_type:complete